MQLTTFTPRGALEFFVKTYFHYEIDLATDFKSHTSRQNIETVWYEFLRGQIAIAQGLQKNTILDICGAEGCMWVTRLQYSLEVFEHLGEYDSGYHCAAAERDVVFIPIRLTSARIEFMNHICEILQVKYRLFD